MSKIKRAKEAIVDAAESMGNYEESEFDDTDELIEIAIEEVKSALKVEFRGE